MTSTDDRVLEAELDAYVDDQLDVRRRIEVESYLARHPPLASRVMAELRVRDELRCALAAPGGVEVRNAATARLARKLEGGLARARLMVHLRRAAVVVLLIGSGWVANAKLGPLLIGAVVAATQPPAYVADAVMAHRTALLRGEMKSQIETPDFDGAEIRAATAIVIPKLPKDWTVLDVQVFPSTFGPSVQMTIRTEELGLLSIYAARPGVVGNEPAVAKQVDPSTAAAYWQVGEVAYTLVARTDSDTLLARANRMAGKLDPSLKASRARASW